MPSGLAEASRLAYGADKSAWGLTLKLRDHWPVAAFCAALLICTVLGLVSFGTGWCEANERSVVCARNWFNAAGNVAGAVIAVIAAGFAYAQVRTANRQAMQALIPRISSRLEGLHELEETLLDAERNIFLAGHSIASIADDTFTELSRRNLLSIQSEAEGYIQDLDAQLRRLKELSRDAASELELYELSKDAQIWVRGFIRAVNPVLIRLKDLLESSGDSLDAIGLGGGIVEDMKLRAAKLSGYADTATRNLSRVRNLARPIRDQLVRKLRETEAASSGV